MLSARAGGFAAGVCLNKSRAAAGSPGHASPFVVRASVLQTTEVRAVDFDGKDAGSATLTLKTAGNNSKGVVHKYLVMTMQNARSGNASTKTKSEVSGGGKKPYAQKGTGNARQGSSRTPLRVGGGVVFGPKPKDWSIKMNKKERRLAMSSALMSAAPAMTVVDDVTAEQFGGRKTKDLVAALGRWGVAEGQTCLLISRELSENLYYSGRNVPTLGLTEASSLNVYDILRADRLVVERSALAYLNDFYTSSYGDAEVEEVEAGAGAAAA